MDILDIHTHSDSACGILNVRPIDFSPQKGRCYSVGIHPWHVKEDYKQEWEMLQKVASHPQVLAIGEAGLDKIVSTDTLLQEKVFTSQIELAERLGKPLIIHCVRSFNEIIRLKELYCTSVPWIIHGFRGKQQLASQLIKYGFYLSFGEKYQLEALRKVPLERLFIETDESKVEVVSLYRKAAECLSLPYGGFTERVRQNIKDVFFSR